MGKSVSEEKIKQIEEMMLQSPEKSNRVIADLVDVSKSTVQRYRKKLIDEGKIGEGDSYESRMDKQAKKIEDTILQRPRETAEAIANLLNISRNTVQRYRKKLIAEGKISEGDRYEARMDEQAKKIEDTILQNPREKSQIIASMLGVTKRTVQEYRKKLVDEGRIAAEDTYKARVGVQARKIEETILQNPKLSNKAIAEMLSVGERTIKRHRARLITEGKLEDNECTRKSIEDMILQKPNESNKKIADMLRTSERTVQRYRKKLIDEGKLEDRESRRKEIEDTILQMPAEKNKIIASLLCVGETTVKSYRKRLIAEGMLTQEKIDADRREKEELMRRYQDDEIRNT